MDLLKYNNKLSKNDKLSFQLITVCLVLVLIFQTFNTFFSGGIIFLFDLTILFVGACGCLFFLKHHYIKGFTRWFMWLIPYFIIVGMLYGDNIFGGNRYIVLGQDLRYVMLFLMGGIFAYNSSMMYSFHWLMKWLAIISIIFGVLGLLSFNFTETVIEDREDTWTMSYYYWWASASCFLYWGYYFLFVKKHKLLGIGVFVTYMVLGALFIKRSSLVEGIVILLLYFLLEKGNKFGLMIKVLIISFLAIVATYSIAPKLFFTITDTYSARFEQLAENEGDSRNEEEELYMKFASPMQLFFGNGIGHYVIDRRDGSVLNAIHIGWANTIYKGGIIYVLFYMAILLQVIYILFNVKRMNPYQKTCLGVTLSFFFSFLYGGTWTYTLTPVCISAPMFYLLSKNKHEFV